MIRFDLRGRGKGGERENPLFCRDNRASFLKDAHLTKHTSVKDLYMLPRGNYSRNVQLHAVARQVAE